MAANTQAEWAGSCRSLLAAMLLAFCGGAFAAEFDQAAKSSGPEGEFLASQVDALRNEHKLVGLAARVLVDGQVVAEAVAGERKAGSGVANELGDQWHLGSITKSITATMIGRLVESGKMKWTDTVGERFSDAAIHEDWKPVTLRQLLTHTAGATPNFSAGVMLLRQNLGDDCTQERRAAAMEVLATKPDYPPGTKHVYSNAGYTIAGAMAEVATGTSWEELCRREVYEPLGLASAGFGAPSSPDKTLDQPRGHRVGRGKKIAAGDKVDITPIVGPAGTAHMTLADLSTYTADHLAGELGAGKLLSGKTYQALHTPERDNYACGWVKNDPSYAIPHVVHWHNGSNTMWYALTVFIPAKKMVVSVSSNDGDVPQAEAAAWKIVAAMARRHKTEGDAAARRELSSDAVPKTAPFTAVRWRDAQPEVRLGEEWLELVSLDGIAADKIVAFCKATYDDKWQKRFAEDLVEVLVRMGHEPADRVRLEVRKPGTSEIRTIDDVEMTAENRKAVRAAAED